jgi:polysaccharide export outer membrane protein
MTRSILMLSAVALLGGCTTLSADGPSSRAIDRGAVTATDSLGGYALVPLDYQVSERIKSVAPQFLGSLAAASSQTPIDVIGVGDALAVAVYEPSGALFGPRGNASSVQSGSQNLPPVVVDRNGAVGIPFAGNVRVAGLTSSQAADAIRRALIGKVGNPQVIVSIAENASNAVTVLGEVKNPGRAPLSLSADRILDVIAAAGGSTRPIEDVLVNIQRDGQTFTAPLSAVTTDFAENVRLARGDQVNLTFRPRRFSTFGALGAVRQTDIPAGPLTLAGALSGAGGLDTNAANARRVLVFRFERPEVAHALGLTQAPTVRGVPVVYQLDLSEGAGLFTASNFLIQPDDILYVPRSSSAELRKFFEFVQTVTRVVYDVSVTSALNLE